MSNTNLAAEFFVLSTLHRLGLAATLTLGNTKAVDIFVARPRGDFVTIDVKGLAGTTGFPIDNVGRAQRNHFLIFVSYLKRIAEPTVSPEVYIVPHRYIARLAYRAPAGRRLVTLSALRNRGARFRDAWQLLRRAS